MHLGPRVGCEELKFSCECLFFFGHFYYFSWVWIEYVCLFPKQAFPSPHLSFANLIKTQLEMELNNAHLNKLKHLGNLQLHLLTLTTGLYPRETI